MAKVTKLVFTGGDCGGKSTALNYSAEKLRDKGVKIKAKY